MIIKSAHDSKWSAHLGIDKTLKRIQSFYFWPDLYVDVSNHVKACSPCQRKARLLRLDRVPIKAIKCGLVPFEVLNLDLIGPIDPASIKGFKYILCVIDSVTRWIECVPLKGLTAKEAFDGLITVFCRIGLPIEGRHDMGTNLISGLNTELYDHLGINMRCSTPLHPETNGLIERWNQTLKKCCTTCCIQINRRAGINNSSFCFGVTQRYQI